MIFLIFAPQGFGNPGLKLVNTFGVQITLTKLFARLTPINMTLGTEWLIDASGCEADALADVERLREVFGRVINDLDLHVVGEIVWATFSEPGGVSGLALLAESHLACHTYPEFRAATFNLYCCRSRAMWPWEKMLQELLGATAVRVRVFERMVHESTPALEEAGAAR